MDRKNGNKNCLNELNELKVCEVSRNLISNNCWKFQLSILKNKKSFMPKKIFVRPLSLNMPREIQKMVSAVLIFSEGFGLCVPIQINKVLYFLNFEFQHQSCSKHQINIGSLSFQMAKKWNIESNINFMRYFPPLNSY